jgi:mono/diheme cytochrome c family protein
MSKFVLLLAALAFCLATLPAFAAGKDAPISDDDAAGIFASVCGFCHEDGGRVAGKGPQLMGTKRSDAFIIARIKTGKEGRMPAFGQALSDGEIKGILHYIRNLKPD